MTGNGEPEASLPAEVVLQGADWYDYEAKYAPGGVELEIPARVDPAAIAEVQALARETFVRVGCSGLARVDFFVEDGGRVLVNELNTLPGMTADERLPEDVGGERAVVPVGLRPAAGAGAGAVPRGARGARVLGRRLPEQGDLGDLDALLAAGSFVIHTR